MGFFVCVMVVIFCYHNINKGDMYERHDNEAIDMAYNSYCDTFIYGCYCSLYSNGWRQG